MSRTISFYITDNLNFDLSGRNVGKEKRNYFDVIYDVLISSSHEFEKKKVFQFVSIFVALLTTTTTKMKQLKGMKIIKNINIIS